MLASQRCTPEGPWLNTKGLPVIKWRRGDSNPGPKNDSPQRLRAYLTDKFLQPPLGETTTAEKGL